MSGSDDDDHFFSPNAIPEKHGDPFLDRDENEVKFYAPNAPEDRRDAEVSDFVTPTASPSSIESGSPISPADAGRLNREAAHARDVREGFRALREEAYHEGLRFGGCGVLKSGVNRRNLGELKPHEVRELGRVFAQGIAARTLPGELVRVPSHLRPGYRGLRLPAMRPNTAPAAVPEASSSSDVVMSTPPKKRKRESSPERSVEMPQAESEPPPLSDPKCVQCCDTKVVRDTEGNVFYCPWCMTPVEQRNQAATDLETGTLASSSS